MSIDILSMKPLLINELKNVENKKQKYFVVSFEVVYKYK